MASSKRKIVSPRQKKNSTPTPVRVVAIGASAGGLEAFSALLRALSGEIPMALVLIQHLDPERHSVLPELLARTTHLSVAEVMPGAKVEANRVYVMPSEVNIVISNGHFAEMPRSEIHGQNTPINMFMGSLAEVDGNRAIGVVLSGTGSDGTEGIEAIHAAGGVTFAQSPKTAKFDGMPKSAIRSGCIDQVLSPQEIAVELSRMGLHPGEEREHREQASSAQAEESKDKDSDIFEDVAGLHSVLLLLREVRGCDFTEYKPNTLRRRMQQRIASLRLNSLAEYREYLEDHSEEIDKLCDCILIPVTQFFRDPAVFAALKKKVFPAIAGDRPTKAHFRIWVPACSTGEEVYSLAIALLEFLGPRASGCRIQIFGSDINANGIARARSAVYPVSIEEHVSAARLLRFFTKVENGYRVLPEVRELCVFAQQDVANDPPFSNLDLVSCRNLLIYLEPELQQKIFSVLHYSLKPKGFLLLGLSESAESYSDLFTDVDKKLKLYSPRPTVRRLQQRFRQASQVDTGRRFAPAEMSFPSQGSQSDARLQQVVDRIVLEKFAPAGVVVNDSLEIVQFRGGTNQYLNPSTGRASLNLLKMVREELALAMRAVIAKAKKEGSLARKTNVAFEHNGRRRTVNLTVTPIQMHSSSPERFYLVLFEDTTPPKAPVASGKTSSGARDVGPLMAELRSDLAASRAGLRDNIAMQDSLREDYQSANEELLSANEELQSTNEELETSKEELQSTNEELITVNDELNGINFQLKILTNDLTNLLDSIVIPVVMVDRRLAIRRMTPVAEKVFKVLSRDLGRRITDMKSDLDLDLKPLLMSVIQDAVNIDREVQDHEGHWYWLQIKPYRMLDGKIDGAILVLVDIDAIKKSNLRLKSAEEFTTAIVETMPGPVLVLTADLRVKSANRAFYSMFEVEPEATLNQLVYRLGNAQWDIVELRILLEQVLPEKKEFSNYEVIHAFPDIGTKLLLLSGRYMTQAPGEDALILLSFADLTQRRNAELALIQAEKLAVTGRLAASIAHEINNPLEAATNLIYLASQGSDLEAAQSYTKQALEQLLRVSHITQQTLRFHRQSSNPTAVNLAELLDSVIDFLGARITGNHITVKRLYDGAPEVMLLAADIRQVMANLVGNAIEAMPRGGSLSVRVRQSNDWRDRTRPGVRLTVGDTGTGMSRKVLRRIYEPFFTTNKKDGTGLGMWVTSQLVERHQGDLRVWSSERQGATGTVFSLFLPLHLPEQKLEAEANKADLMRRPD